MKKLYILLFSLILSTTCFASDINWNSNTITAIGIGSAPASVTAGQGDALARRAAIVDAYRNLAGIVYGVELENHTTVQQLAVKKDTIKTAISGAINNARITDEEQLDNGNYQVTLCMPIFGQRNSLASALWQDKVAMPDFASQSDPVAPTTTVPAVTETPVVPAAVITPAATAPTVMPAGAITGVVIDCRGLGLERAMAPNILDNSGRTIYNSKNVDDSAIIKNGLASYSKSDSPSNIDYAGANPLIVKAVSLMDFNRNPVVSKEDGDKILAANQNYAFLKKCAVVFIE
ncbi:LPP20 family lipoprotein [Propionispira raffinosivorans]|jgi:hypothetical protein|uniref:LPP20 family lipoprotein n=1 Tax=Propionispira raffinosivorans TaxID=86959 RepID=UPI00035D2DBB|nr:LPP20 family lipoprotein [Propionispira raffinosivorans]